jgi:hypothetical protein
VQIRPGIQRCNVLRRIVRIGLRIGLRHRVPVQFPLLHDFPQTPQAGGAAMRNSPCGRRKFAPGRRVSSSAIVVGALFHEQ